MTRVLQYFVNIRLDLKRNLFVFQLLPGYILCQICHAQFPSIDDLNTHYNEAHPSGQQAAIEKKKFFCEICEKGYVKRQSLAYHTFSAHGVKLGKATKTK